MSTIGALTANTDLQSLMAKMYGNGIGKVNNAEENLESLLVTNSNDINKNDDFLNKLQEQYHSLGLNKTEDVQGLQDSQLINQELGIPSSLQIQSVEDSANTNSYQNLLDKLMGSIEKALDKDGDGEVSQQEFKEGFENLAKKVPNNEVAGTLANFGSGKNLAGNFIQGLINNYKDNGGMASVISSLGSVV